MESCVRNKATDKMSYVRLVSHIPGVTLSQRSNILRRRGLFRLMWTNTRYLTISNLQTHQQQKTFENIVKKGIRLALFNAYIVIDVFHCIAYMFSESSAEDLLHFQKGL